jgi:hypothetical protein
MGGQLPSVCHGGGIEWVVLCGRRTRESCRRCSAEGSDKGQVQLRSCDGAEGPQDNLREEIAG